MFSFLRFVTYLTFIFLPLWSFAQNTHKIDINTADVATLDQALEGIGGKKAQAIIEYREKHGPFKSIYDLAQVTGIGEKTIERNKDKIEVFLVEDKSSVDKKSGSSPDEKPAASSSEKSSSHKEDKSKSSSDPSEESPKVEEKKEVSSK